tara:strand:- start:138 stop:287 length:150 start_codon:yes stop_codon:yes gene_type:complete
MIETGIIVILISAFLLYHKPEPDHHTSVWWDLPEFTFYAGIYLIFTGIV